MMQTDTKKTESGIVMDNFLQMIPKKKYEEEK